MKLLKRITILLLALVLCMQMLPVAALDEDETDPEDWTDETTTAAPVVTTTAPVTQIPTFTVPSPTTTIVTEAPESPAPIVYITRRNMHAKPACGESFTVDILFQNYSAISVLQGLAVIEPGEGLVLEEKSDSKVVSSISPNHIAEVPVRLRVQKDNEATDIPVQVSYAYSYRTPQGIVSATMTEKLMIQVQKKSDEKSGNALTPNILVTRYNYGNTITAGDAFTLYLEFTNTSNKTAAENIVMSVETGDGVSIAGASNTYFFPTLAAGKTATQRVPMRVSTSAVSQGARVEITFRYEYTENGTRGSTSTSESLSVPIHVPDRFLLTQPDTELIGMQNEELAVSVPYVNKGRSEVSNVQARLIYDESVATCEQPLINLGNFEPGKSGTIDFYFIPTQAGSGSVQVVVTYEDELLQEKTLTVSVPYSADEMYIEPAFDDEFGEGVEEPQSPVKKVLLIVIPVLVVVALIVLVVVLKKRKKKKEAPSVAFDWGFAQPEEHRDENR